MMTGPCLSNFLVNLGHLQGIDRSPPRLAPHVHLSRPGLGCNKITKIPLAPNITGSKLTKSSWRPVVHSLSLSASYCLLSPLALILINDCSPFCIPQDRTDQLTLKNRSTAQLMHYFAYPTHKHRGSAVCRAIATYIHKLDIAPLSLCLTCTWGMMRLFDFVLHTRIDAPTPYLFFFSLSLAPFLPPVSPPLLLPPDRWRSKRGK